MHWERLVGFFFSFRLAFNSRLGMVRAIRAFHAAVYVQSVPRIQQSQSRPILYGNSPPMHMRCVYTLQAMSKNRNRIHHTTLQPNPIDLPTFTESRTYKQAPSKQKTNTT